MFITGADLPNEVWNEIISWLDGNALKEMRDGKGGAALQRLAERNFEQRIRILALKRMKALTKRILGAMTLPAAIVDGAEGIKNDQEDLIKRLVNEFNAHCEEEAMLKTRLNSRSEGEQDLNEAKELREKAAGKLRMKIALLLGMISNTDSNKQTIVATWGVFEKSIVAGKPINWDP